MTVPSPSQITGLVLAGGRGSRMGGADKGLQRLRGRPLVQHALQRLQPQVGALMISANRHLDAYRALGFPVWPDATADHAGPLAGLLAGLQHCSTPWLACVPCDTPGFPADLVERLAQGAAEADLAVAVTQEGGVLRSHPVFCLLRRELCPALEAAVQAGERKVGRWASDQRCAQVVFDDAQAFFNANTADELQRLEAGWPGD